MKNTPIFRMLLAFGILIAIGILRMPYLYRFCAIGLGTLCVVNVVRVVRGHGMKWHGFRYTRARMYLMLVLLLLPCIITRPPQTFWIKFAAWGLIGILGESLCNLYWEQVFGKRLWSYLKDPILDGHSSWLNVIVWGLGGSFYHSLSQKAFYVPTTRALLLFWALVLMLFLLLSIGRHIQKTRHPTARLLTFHGYVIIFSPFLGALVMTSLLSGQYQMIVAALAYGIGAWVVEYFLGKILTFMLTDQLWIYVPDAMDRGHLTVWSLLPFMFGGFLFMSISHIFTYFE